MATVTPNFNWPVPTSTDLVKDGATAIEALGDSIDASLLDLKGGTTGQVLSKTTNTDMDFTWVTTDDANAIQNSIVDAKGDLISATANDTPARLAVGANGETLVADSSTSTGLRYQVPVNANPVLNSAMQVWQRGTSVSVPSSVSTYTADRWALYRGATGMTVSRQTTSDTTNLPFIQYCARIQRNAGDTSTVVPYFSQSFETVNSIPYAGKTMTLSFYVRSGANFSSATGISVNVVTGTGTDQSWLGYTGTVFALNKDNQAITTTWQRLTYTFSIGATATELTPIFSYNPSGTAGANDYFEITGVQLEVGSVATSFKTYAATLQGELSACQRYYYENTKQANRGFCMGQAYSTTQGVCTFTYPVTMRVNPTISLSAAADFDLFNSTASRLAVTAFTAQDITNENFQAILTVASGLVAGNGTGLASDSGGAAAIKVSAEL